MQILLRLLRGPCVATSHNLMRRLSTTSRSSLSFMASAPPCWSTPALARQVFPLMVVPSPAVRRVSQFSHGSQSMPSTSASKDDQSGCEEDRRIATKDSAVIPMELEKLSNSRHRDGSLCRTTNWWKRDYQVKDRRETRLPVPTDCKFVNGSCYQHEPSRLLQIFSLKLAQLSVNLGSVALYGYIAVRDHMDPLLNYVVNISRDDPIIVEEGSLIIMTGPTRGIDMYGIALVEYDMRIKNGKAERDDLQLIDGVSAIDDLWGNHEFTRRILGDCGSVDITVARIDEAVQATIEVVISEVQSSFKFCLGCFIGGYNGEEIRLFDGAIHVSHGLKKLVVAARNGSTMELKLKVASESSTAAEHGCSFKADTHGLATQEIKTNCGLISLKVTWSTLLSS